MGMAAVARLVTFADVDDRDVDPGPGHLAVSARHEAELTDGRRVLLLDDRGWASSGPPDLWDRTSVDEITDTARMVVGPDEPFEGRSHEDMEVDHWTHLEQILRWHGVGIEATELAQLPHDVELSTRLRARLSGG